MADIAVSHNNVSIRPDYAFKALPDNPAIARLKSCRQWVAWKYELRGDRWTKPPVNPHCSFGAKVSVPSTWGSYDQAIQRMKIGNLAGVGFVLAEDDKLSGADLDNCRNKFTGEINPWAAEIVSFAETYIEISPSGCGLRIIWEGKIDATFKADSLGIEVYRSQRYLTITGQHLAGSPTKIGQAPRTIAALRARYDAWKRDIDAERAAQKEIAPINNIEWSDKGRPSSNFFRQVNDTSLRMLSSWVPSIFSCARFQPGTGAYRIPSHALGRNLQEDLSIAPNGIVDFGVHDIGDPRHGKRTPIDLVIEYGGAPDAVAAARWICSQIGVSPTSLGWDDDESRVELGHKIVEQILDEHPVKVSPLNAIKLGQDVDWTRPTGLLNEIAEWIMSSSRRPNKPFAVASAIATLSSVCGRHLYGPTGTALNVYIVCLAPTGVGKGRPLGAVAELLQSADLGNLHVSGKLFSVSAIESLIKDQPCCVATIDEIGTNLLSKMSHSRASSHELAMRGSLLELWSREHGAPPFCTHGRAESKSTQVHCPSLSLFGVSTPDAFYSAMKASSIKDGFLNRFLIVGAAPRAKSIEVSEEARRVPRRLARGLMDIVPEAEGNLGKALGVFSPAMAPDGMRLQWDSQATLQLALDLEEQVLGIMDANPDMSPFLGRIFEYTVRLASLHAVSKNGLSAVVSSYDLAWGASLSVQSARALTDSATSLMAHNDYEEKFNLVRNIIKECGMIGQRDLLRKVRSVNARDRKEIIEHLKSGGWIVDYVLKTKTKPAEGWKWIG